MDTLGDPVVFVVDDDASMRSALGNLILSVGFQFEAFSSALEFLRHKRAMAPACLVLDVRLKGLSGLELQRKLAGGRRSDTDHFHHGSWRYSDDSAGDESRSHRVPPKTVPRPGFA